MRRPELLWLVHAFVAVVFAIASYLASTAANAEKPEQVGVLPTPLTWLRDVDETIKQDVRYATANNFTLAPVPGYAEPDCILTRPTAEALAKVQRDLKARGLSLKVYDCYRPVHSVAAFVRWATQSIARNATNRFHPNVPRSRLIPEGYIAARSGHSRGNAIDVTLVKQPAPSRVGFDSAKAYGPCTGPVDARAPDDSVDMGTGFDCFDIKSRTVTTGLSADQQQWRRVLLEAMKKHGFLNYPKEWWHYSFPSGDAGQVFDVPVAAHH
jgi:D-alanyl-D-alanine dipeptidase